MYILTLFSVLNDDDASQKHDQFPFSLQKSKDFEILTVIKPSSARRPYQVQRKVCGTSGYSRVYINKKKDRMSHYACNLVKGKFSFI